MKRADIFSPRTAGGRAVDSYTEKDGGAAGRALLHDSAHHHVQGAEYIDDMPLRAGTLHAAFGAAGMNGGDCPARAKVVSLNAEAARKASEVFAAAADIPGINDIAPVHGGDPLLAAGEVQFAGQPLFALAAKSYRQAWQAARRFQATFRPLPAVLDVEDALAKKHFLVSAKDCPVIARGDVRAALKSAPHTLSGKMHIGGQEHFYLEGQAAYAVPEEGGRVKIFSSTQNPAEIQHLAAQVLGKEMGEVAVAVRRLGGGFGGKETQAAMCAAMCALLAHKSGRPVTMRLPRAQDFITTGKRHPFFANYRIGFDGRGRILGADILLAADCGCSADLSHAILARAMMHADNAYYLPAARIRGFPCKTHKVSNTAFRGFGGPQGMAVIERIMDDIARRLNMDPLQVRLANAYRGRRQTTPYGQPVADNIAAPLMRELAKRADYRRRRARIAAFNKTSAVIKRGLALTPVKFGISFTTGFLNQAGALLHVYRDGDVLLNHGGVEMGQGLFIKIAQIVADELGVEVSRVRCTATATDKVANTSPTAASAGCDMNGFAAQKAAAAVRARLEKTARRMWNLAGRRGAKIIFHNGRVRAAAGGKSLHSAPFAEVVEAAYLAREPLWAQGFYRTPKIHFDKQAQRGRPFYYFAYGAAATEVAVDALTGEHKILRVDILHDVGASINPAADLGQVEGGFAQGAGWLTGEELFWDAGGRLQTVGPATYKIPAAGDMPADWRVHFYRAANRENTVRRSKAVGEPPLMLALSVLSALGEAVAAAGGDARLDAPATPARVLAAVHKSVSQRTQFLRLTSKGGAGG